MTSAEKKAYGIAIKKRIIEIDGMTQRKLAQEIGCSEYYLWQITGGRRAPGKYKRRIEAALQGLTENVVLEAI